jgi:NAD(P)-dependent dehydrogenase (short-subunit alcohol dehydrogenase family)
LGCLEVLRYSRGDATRRDDVTACGSFDGRVAIVTGAARGIGLAVAGELAGGGAALALVDRDAERLEDAVRRTASTAHAQAFVADVTDAPAVERVVADVVAALGGVDILVNNAGVAGRSVPTWELTDDDWQSVVSVNLSGTFHCTRAVLPVMRERGYGRIVNVASIAGKEGNPNAAPYSASKAGIIGFTKAVAKEVAAAGILVNCVTPAVIRTEILGQVSEAHLEYMLSRIPMGRAGEPEEVAELVAWLASERCSFSTGAVFDISGGRATY